MPSVDLNLTVPQSRAFSLIGPRQNVTLPWGRGCGKSFFVRNIVWLLIAQHYGRLRTDALKPFRGIRVGVLMPTLRQFVGVHGDLILDELSPGGTWGALGGKVNKTKFEVKFPDGSFVTPVPASSAHSQRARGYRFDVVISDEVDDIERAVFDSVARPWFSEPWSLKMRLAGGTPRRGKQGLLYHLHKLGLSQDPLDERYHSIHATYRDNPELVDLAEVEDARRNTPPTVYKREWECDFEAAEGLVYGDVWDERFHVRPPPENLVFKRIIVGGDAGWEDPGCLLLGGVTGSGNDAVLWVLDEVYEQHRTPDWWCGRLKIWTDQYDGTLLYHDPSAPSLKEAYRKATGISLRDVDNSIEEGIATVANMMLPKPVETLDEEGNVIASGVPERAARIYVHPRCKNLIRELGMYKRKADPLNPDSYLEDIVGRNDHAPDCLRYMCVGHFGMYRGGEPRRANKYENRN